MNRRNILSITAITALGLALLPGSAVAQQKPLKDQLVGGWNSSPGNVRLPTEPRPTRTVRIPRASSITARMAVSSSCSARRSAENCRQRPSQGDTGGSQGARGRGDRLLRNLHGGRAEQDDLTAPDVTTFPNQSANQKRTITSLTADELKFTNPTATAGGRIDVTMKRAPRRPRTETHSLAIGPRSASAERGFFLSVSCRRRHRSRRDAPARPH